MRQLIIAEKPSMAAAIAEALIPNAPKKGAVFDDGKICVTSAAGHIKRLEPEKFASSLSELPHKRVDWRKVVIEDKAFYLDTIERLIRAGGFTEIIHAGDSGREGQLIIEEILADITLPAGVKISRLWVNALDAKSVRKAYEEMRPNSEYRGLYYSALAREKVDYTLGINITEAVTLATKSSRARSGGRVQTPTLNLLAEREAEIKNFTPVDYFDVLAQVVAGGNDIVSVVWVPSEKVQLVDKLLLDRKVADSVVKKVKGKQGRVSKFDKTKREEKPPLPLDLTTLSRQANREFNFSASTVLKLAQKLYDEKAITYPRTNCRYLAENDRERAGEILQNLAGFGYSEITSHADQELKSEAWNDEMIANEEHTALIPTGHLFEMTPDERKIFDLIVRHYLAQFFPPYKYLETKIEIVIMDELFRTSGRTPESQGWKVAFPAKGSAKPKAKAAVEQAVATLPLLAVGEPVTCRDAAVIARQTKCPERLSEGELLHLMENIHTRVKDPAQRAMLKATSGLGTVATRSATIEILKIRGYVVVETSGKTHRLQPTPLGLDFIDKIPSTVKDPGYTALLEQKLDEITRAPDPIKLHDELISEVDAYTAEIVGSIVANFKPIQCPTCKVGFLSLRPENFWGCSGYKSDKSGCNERFDDAGGKPLLNLDQAEFPCESCKNGYLRRYKRKTGPGYGWGCSNYKEGGCSVFYDDKKGKPDFEVYGCPECKEGQLRKITPKPREGEQQKPEPFWGCTGYASGTCKKTFPDKRGKPDLSFKQRKKKKKKKATSASTV